MPTVLDKKRKIIAFRNAAHKMNRTNAAAAASAGKKRKADAIAVDITSAKQKKAIVSSAIEEVPSDAEEDTFVALLEQQAAQAKKKQKTTDTKAEDSYSASSWFDQMTRQIEKASSSTTEAAGSKKSKKKKADAITASSIEEIATADEVDPNAIAAKFMQSAPLLSERTDLFNAKLERKKLAEAALLKKKSGNAKDRLNRKLAALDKGDDKTDSGSGVGDDFLGKLLKSGTAGYMDDDDDDDEFDVAPAAAAVSYRPKPVKPEDRYIADHSVIGTSTSYDDYFADEKAALDEKSAHKDSTAKKARVAHKVLICDGQEPKIQATREILDSIEEAEAGSRTKTTTLVFVSENKHATLLYSRIGRQITKHLKNKKGWSSGGLELRTKGVEVMHDGLKAWEQDRSYVRVRSGRCRALIITDACITKVWDLRHMFGGAIHFDLPESDFQDVYRARIAALGRRTNNFPSNEALDSESNPVDVATLRNSSLALLSHNKQSRLFCEAVLPMVRANGQERVAQAMEELVAEGKVKVRKFM